MRGGKGWQGKAMPHRMPHHHLNCRAMYNGIIILIHHHTMHPPRMGGWTLAKTIADRHRRWIGATTPPYNPSATSPQKCFSNYPEQYSLPHLRPRACCNFLYYYPPFCRFLPWPVPCVDPGGGPTISSLHSYES